MTLQPNSSSPLCLPFAFVHFVYRYTQCGLHCCAVMSDDCRTVCEFSILMSIPCFRISRLAELNSQDVHHTRPVAHLQHPSAARGYARAGARAMGQRRARVPAQEADRQGGAGADGVQQEGAHRSARGCRTHWGGGSCIKSEMVVGLECSWHQ